MNSINTQSSGLCTAVESVGKLDARHCRCLTLDLLALSDFSRLDILHSSSPAQMDVKFIHSRKGTL